ncbi:CamS family sex pheromone protein [Bacillus tianshenii]|nr:CamS family sex pheromone protein [Bacillus tianshenii]
MRKAGVWFLICMLFLTACTPRIEKEEEVVRETQESKEHAIIPKYNLSGDYYRTILPFKPGEARGLITSTVDNRLDINELETGLMRHAQESFEPEDYYFQEGQYLKRETVIKWLDRKESTNAEGEKVGSPEGLNPPAIHGTSSKEANEKSPRYLSHILEHNYFKKNKEDKVELAGVVIGLSLNSVHYYHQEDGYPRKYDIPNDEIVKQGNRIAEEIVKRMRKMKGLKNVPIMVALFKEQPKESVVPGHFFAKTTVDKGETSLEKWDKINEEYILFPSDAAEKKYYDDSSKVMNFTNDVDRYFPNYVGVIGKGFYKDGQLQELTINIPVQFYGKAEVIGFTEYVTGLIMEHFPPYISLQVYVKSIAGQESLITREAGKEEPYVHIYR